MKRFAFFTLVCAVFVMTACSHTDDSIDVADGFGVTSLDAFIEERPDSRTIAEQKEDGSIQMLWRADDEIAVTDLAKTATFKLKSGAKSVHGVFAGSIMSQSKTMYAVYPASAVEMTAGEAKVTLPNIQTYLASADADTGARNIMVGVTADASSFDFYTVAAIARFRVEVDADETVNSITMRVEDGYLSGVGSVDLAGHSLGTLNRRNVTLNYAEPAKGVSSDGWALIAPVDFTATTGNVYYDVTTSKGKYTFCRKPTKALQAGMVYNFPLVKSSFAQVATAGELADGKYLFESNASTLTVNLLRATDTTVSVGWSAHGFPTDYSVDTADSYELYLYDERNQLLVAWQPNDDMCVTNNALFPYSADNPTCPPRFVFTGLTPNTVYKVQAKNLTTSKKSAMLTVSTAPTDCGEVVSAARNEGETILFENFGKLVWNGDITTLAAGYVPSSYSSLTDIADGTAWGDWTSASQTTYKYTKRDREQQFFTTYKSVVNSCGLGDWAWWRNPADASVSATSTAILARPGYLKLGITKVRAGIVTPELSALLGKATVRVTFKACTYGTLSADDSTAVGVCAVDGCTVDSDYKLSKYTEVDRKTFDLDKKLEWNTYSVELGGVTATSRIIIFSNAASVSSANNRFHVDDVKVEFVKYDGATSTDVPVAKQVAASPYSATVEWSEVEQASRKYTVAIYKDSACANKYQEYTTTISSSKTYIEWPARFTFPYLEPETKYYVTVTDLAGNVSKPAAVTTSALRTAGSREVLFEGFDKLCWGGDYINMANSVTLSGVTVGSYSPNALTDALTHTVAASSPTTDGSRLTSCSAKINQLFGLEEWSSNAAHVRQGFVKLGTASEKGWITTPYLCNLSGNSAQIEVSFKACPFVDGAKEQTSFIHVNLLDDSGNVKDTKEVTIGGRRSLPGWETFTVGFSSVAPSDRVQFMAGGDSQSRFCIDDILITSASAVSGPVACGFVKDSNGNPLSGVVVSDGFSAVQTNAAGYYSLIAKSDTWYIFYSIPEDCKVGVNSYGQPCFFERYSPTRRRYDFTVEKLPNGAETEFNLFCFADPQCRPGTHINRFRAESAPDVKKHAATKTLPCYGVTLGDIVYSQDGTNTVSNMPSMRDAMSVSNMGMPVFQVMGNHDYTYFYTNNPLSADATSSTTNIKCQREFETVFGPINYSWNRGNVHIVCMRDIIYNSNTNASNYSLGFTDEQYQWLRQDLSFVPKTKMVILCVHIPIVNSGNKNIQNVLSQLKQFKEGHIMSGHTHYMRNEPTKSGMYEHVHAAVCGSWWYSNVNGDGCPNGYAVYSISGSTMKDWYYKGVNAGMNERDYQIRLYRGNMKCGGKYEYYQYQHGSNVLLANVFNADSSWKVKVYENGVYSGDMTLIANKKYDDTTLPFSSTNSMTNPTLVPNNSSQDFWAIGYHTGVVGRGHIGGGRNSYMTNGFHIYKYTLKNPSASIKVVATDKFGNEYTATEITGDYDYSLAEKP